VRRGAEALDRAGDAGRGADAATDALRTLPDGAQAGTMTVRGVAHAMPGWEMRSLDFVKRAPEELRALRSSFDNGLRRDFLADIGARRADELRAAGLTEAEIARVAAGRLPEGYQVHHIIPLDVGGTNDVANLLLIRSTPEHAILTTHQRALTRDMLPGETRRVDWPAPSQPSIVWPDRPGGGAVALPQGD
jgi:hypothetical protein